MNDSAWRDSRRRVEAKAGVAAARRVLQIERDGDRYMVAGRVFTSWHDASEWVLSQPEGDE